MKILIDNGHGADTPGKCSPDRRLLEYKYCREIAAEVERRLRAQGIDAERIVTELSDIPLAERCRRVNEICRRLGAQNVRLISIHVNAAGSDGKWHDASGWSVWVYRGASQQSRLLAERLASAAAAQGLKIRKERPDRNYWEAGFYLLRHTLCPAVLTENLFQDNAADVDFLLSPLGRHKIATLHTRAL